MKKLIAPKHDKTSKKKSSIKPFPFEKNKGKDRFEGITLGVGIVNMGIQGSKLGADSYRTFITGIYFKQDYVFYTNGHFLVYRKLLKTDIDFDEIKILDGQLWNFTHHKKPKKNDTYVFYKINAIGKNHFEAVSDYGFVKISKDIIYPDISRVITVINEKNEKKFIATELNPHYLQTITSMLGEFENWNKILIDKTNNRNALIVSCTSTNGGAILMPGKASIPEQIENHIRHKNTIEKLFKKKETK